VWNESSDHSYTNCTFESNTADLLAAGMINFMSSPRIDKCSFVNNSTPYAAGVLNDTNSSPIITNSLFYNNVTTNGPGALFNANSSNPLLINCRFLGNSSTNGGVVFSNTTSNPTFINCLFSGNSVVGSVAGVGGRNNSFLTLVNDHLEQHGFHGFRAGRSDLRIGGRRQHRQQLCAKLVRLIRWNGKYRGESAVPRRQRNGQRSRHAG
jgi:hypothetical protein